MNLIIVAIVVKNKLLASLELLRNKFGGTLLLNILKFFAEKRKLFQHNGVVSLLLLLFLWRGEPSASFPLV
jgi:hypothetical protein